MRGASFGKYRLIAELGHGGMADVFLAIQAGPAGSNFRKLSVIKRLRQNLVEEPEFVEMLIDEARIAARLNHPNVVQTNEVGEFGTQYFIAMEYLDGQPLHRIQRRSAQRVKDGKPPALRPEHQIVILMDALAGLHHAHELADYDGSPLQIVHRDVTPQNIFVTYEGQVKVVDFGIAKAAGRASETRQGVVKGKIRYMAPEQAIGGTVDCRADTFAMGILLWEVVTGQRLWKDFDDLEIVRQLIEGAYRRSPRAVEPRVSEELDRICWKALAPARDDRYSSADAFRADLEQYLADNGNLVDARRKLSPAIIELFQDKRVEIKRVIESQLAELDIHGSGEFEPIAMPVDSVSSALRFSHTTSVRLAEAATTEDARAIARDPRAAGGTTSFDRRLRSAAAIVAAVALAAGVVVWRSVSERPSAPPKGTAVEEIMLRVQATPESTTFSIDDGPARRAPIALRVAKDGREHRVRFDADGHVSRTEVARFDADLALSVALLPVAAAVGAALERPRPLQRAATAPASARSLAVNQKGSAANQALPTAAAQSAEPPAPAVTGGSTGAWDMPVKARTKPKTELDNGDPWATK